WPHCGARATPPARVLRPGTAYRNWPRQFGRAYCRAQHRGTRHLGQNGLWLVVPVGEVDTLAHVMPAGLGIHHFSENLQAVAIRVKEVDAVGHAVVGGIVDLGAMLEDPAV